MKKAARHTGGFDFWDPGTLGCLFHDFLARPKRSMVARSASKVRAP
jgi:hypothetical protein